MKSRNKKTNKEGASDHCSEICSACARCQAANNEEIGTSWNDASSQLYSKEAESYFFYYQPENEVIKF